MLRRIRVEDAVGLKLAHDHTRIVPGKFKGAAFRRGHVVRKSDIPKLSPIRPGPLVEACWKPS